MHTFLRHQHSKVDFHTLINTPNRWILLNQLYLIPLDPKNPWKQWRVFSTPNIWGKNPKNEGCGFPWHRLIVIDIINDIHVQTLILLVSPSSHPAFFSSRSSMSCPTQADPSCAALTANSSCCPKKRVILSWFFFPRPVEKYMAKFKDQP